jgi:hypothetical protein
MSASFSVIIRCLAKLSNLYWVIVKVSLQSAVGWGQWFWRLLYRLGIMMALRQNLQITLSKLDRLVNEQSVCVGLSMCPFPSLSVESKYRQGDTSVGHHSVILREMLCYWVQVPVHRTLRCRWPVSANRWIKLYTFNVFNHSIPR